MTPCALALIVRSLFPRLFLKAAKELVPALRTGDLVRAGAGVRAQALGSDGRLIDVETPNGKEQAAQEMILYAPRRVTLPPNQPQAIRLSARAPEGLADGEYRVHLLFRAIPPPSS